MQYNDSLSALNDQKNGALNDQKHVVPFVLFL